MSDRTAPVHWWNSAIVYEIYPRSFQDSDGDGIGDLNGITSRLDYLNDGTRRSLGVDAVWLTPVYPSPLFDFGYDIAEYTQIDPMYGTLGDFDRFVRQAHERGIKVIMDLVANHTSHEHSWFRESRSTRDNPKRDWYVWRDPGADGGPPNNWLSVFGGPAWTLDRTTGQYYLHSFLAEQPDLNWRNPEVREAMFDVVRFWTRRGVDGFRLDAIDHIAKDEMLRDEPPSPAPLPPGSTGHDALVHVYSQRDPIIHEWLQELRGSAEEDGQARMLVSEIYGLTPEDVRLFHGADRPEMSLSFNFDVLAAPWEATAYREAIEGFARHLPPGVWPNVVLNNHDQSRFISRNDWDGRGEERARVAAMLALTMRGAAFLYYGEEIGMRDGEIDFQRLQDPVGKRYYPDNPGRDPERTPMQWAPGPGAGFTTGNPWLPISSDHVTVNVQSESQDPDSLLRLYRELIWLRKRSPALTEGSYRAVEDPGRDVYAYLREVEGQRFLVALNFSLENASFRLPGSGIGRVMLSTIRRAGSQQLDCDRFTLGSLEGVVALLD
jgi:alpha-glucosidase